MHLNSVKSKTNSAPLHPHTDLCRSHQRPFLASNINFRFLKIIVLLLALLLALLQPSNLLLWCYIHLFCSKCVSAIFPPQPLSFFGPSLQYRKEGTVFIVQQKH